MSLVVRFIKSSRWDPPDGIWLKSGDYPADTLVDLETRNNALSIYFVQTEAEIERLVAAIAASRDFINNVDYALFNLSDFNRIGIELAENRGETPDQQVNAWHRDVIQMSVHRIIELVKVIWSARKERVQQKRIKELLVESAVEGYIQRDLIKKDKMREQIDQLLAAQGRSWPLNR